jgi:hypothetical protein
MTMLISLTSRQRRIADWAIDPMHDFFSEQLESGETLYMPEMPLIQKDVHGHYEDVLEIPEDKEVIGDLLYRLLNLFQDICSDAQDGIVADFMIDGRIVPNTAGRDAQLKRISEAKKDATSALQLARKIMSAAKRHHIRPVEYVTV